MPALKQFKVVGFIWIFLTVAGPGFFGQTASAADNANPATPAPATTNSTSLSAPADAEGKGAETALIATQEALRSNLQIQAQLHDALLAIEKSRQEAEAAAARNAELLDARLSLMEKTLAEQRSDELRELEHSDRMMVIAAGCFAGVGFLVLLASASLQWAGANRLAKLATVLPTAHSPALLGAGETHLLASQALEKSNARFLSLIDQMEKRIRS
ncbi:MAG TPA: hypothetical protein VFB72_19075, partial [Verrucomicrobiae bacterium]|nr:hypothetical protein [Verrucomicrobiae bacterium]